MNGRLARALIAACWCAGACTAVAGVTASRSPSGSCQNGGGSKCTEASVKAEAVRPEEQTTSLRQNFTGPDNLVSREEAAGVGGAVTSLPIPAYAFQPASSLDAVNRQDEVKMQAVGNRQSPRIQTDTVTFDLSVGTAAPPQLLCGQLMSPFPVDERPDIGFVTEVETPCGTAIQFPSERPLIHLTAGTSWSAWSHGYRGDVYWTYYATETTLTFPPGNSGKFHMYIAPNSGNRRFKLIVNGTFESEEFTVDGFDNGQYVGICAAPELQTIKILNLSGNHFAIGDMGMNCVDPGESFGACCDASNGVCEDAVDAYDCLLPRHYTADTTCADLSSPCGNPGACCDEFAGICTDNVLEVDCVSPGMRFTGGMTCSELGQSCGTMGVQFDTAPNSPAPPGWLCNAPMESLPLDDAAIYELVIDIDTPCPDLGPITFDHVMQYMRPGEGWGAAWGHGYWGNLYYSGRTYHEVTLTFPQGNNGKFYGFVTPNSRTETHNFQIIVNGVPLPEFPVVTGANPGYFSVCAEPEIETLRIVCTTGKDFTIGDLGMACVGAGEFFGACCDPFAGVCEDGIDAYECAPPLQFAADTLCADLDTCGNPGACCDEFEGTCAEDILELNCQGPGQRFIEGGTCGEFDPPCGAMSASFEFQPGTNAPPAELCGYAMTPLAPDERPLADEVTDVPLPCVLDGNIEFDRPMYHLRVGGGWNSWSHGYTGDVYYALGATEVTLRFPSDVTYGKFHGYVQPNPAGTHSFKIIVNGVHESEEFTVNGTGGATYFGVCGTPRIDTVKIVCTSGADFAVGEFSVSCFGAGEYFGACCDPFTATCFDGIDVYDCPATSHFTPGTLCADLETPCGNPGACCDDFNGICEDGVMEIECDGGRRFYAGATCDEISPLCGEGGPRMQFGEGEAPPLTFVCDKTVTPFGVDNRPIFELVSDIELPCGAGGIDIYPPVYHATVADEGGAFGDWPHGYQGDTYFNMGDVDGFATTLTFPPGYQTFQGYLRSSPNRVDDLKIVVNGVWESPTFTLEAASFLHFAICADSLETVEFISLRSQLYSFGELSIGCFQAGEITGACCNSASGVCIDNVDIVNCLPPLRFGRGELCAELDPPCGNPGACCDELAGQCLEGVLEADCSGAWQRFGGGGCADLDPPCGQVSVEFGFEAGTGTPPAYVCECGMLDVPDPRAQHELYRSVPLPCVAGGDLQFEPGLIHVTGAGAGWAGIHHGDDVYRLDEGSEATLTFPPGYSTFYGYVGPRNNSNQSYKLVVNGLYESEEFTGGADYTPLYFRVCSNDLQTLTIICTSGAPFTIGHFGVCCNEFAPAVGACCDPFAGVCTDDALPSECPAPNVFTEGQLCSELDPPCDTRGACCDEAAGTCTDNSLEGNCAGRFEPDVLCEELVPACGDFTPCVIQTPRRNSPTPSDLDCNVCDESIRIMADSINIRNSTAISHVSVWGGYLPGNEDLEGSFTIKLWKDTTGVPGDLVFEVGPVAPDYRVRTHHVLDTGLVEWRYTFAIPECVQLDPGVYWVEVYNDTLGSDETWYWVNGWGDDNGGSISGFVVANGLPEAPWVLDYGQTMALQLVCGECASPICELNGDGVVDMSDYQQFRAAFGTTDPAADLDGDGLVTWADYMLFWNCFQDNRAF